MNPSSLKKKRGARGEGSIHKRTDGRYEVTLPVAITGGKRVRLYARTKSEAVILKRDAIASHAKGANLTAKRVTLRDYMEEHVEEVIAKTRSAATLRGYRQHMRNHILPALGNVRLDQLTVTDVRRFISSLTDKGLSPNSVRLVHAALAATLSRALREEMVVKNVAAKAELPKIKMKHRDFITEDEAKRIIAACDTHRFGLAVKLALLTALRKGELLGLKWDSIDLDAQVIKIESQLQRVKDNDFSTLALVPLKTQKSVRSLYIPAKLCDDLRKHREAQLFDEYVLGDEWKGEGFVFTTLYGTPIEPRNFNKSFGVILKRAGVNHYRVHDLRHGGASIMLHNGADLKVIQEVLGHSQFSLTADIYSHVMCERKKEVAAKLNELL